MLWIFSKEEISRMIEEYKSRVRSQPGDVEPVKSPLIVMSVEEWRYAQEQLFESVSNLNRAINQGQGIEAMEIASDIMQFALMMQREGCAQLDAQLEHARAMVTNRA
jgi:hypothetical protein